VEQCAFHFALDGPLIHKESDEGRRQLARTQFDRPAAATSTAEAGAGGQEQMEDEGVAEGEEGDAEGGEGGEGEGESREEDVAAAADGAAGVGDEGAKVIRNQFNFSERASQTYAFTVKERAINTEPPAQLTFAGNVTQWVIYDAYVHPLPPSLSQNKQGQPNGNAIRPQH